MRILPFENLYCTRHDPAAVTSLAEASLLIACRLSTPRCELVPSSLRSSSVLFVRQPEYDTDAAPPQWSDDDLDLRSRAEVRNHLSSIELPLEVTVDITGMMRSLILILIDELFGAGVERVRVFYAEPERYQDNEQTRFARTLAGMGEIEGFNNPRANGLDRHDLLVVGVGYDRQQHRMVVEGDFAASRRKVLVFGLPSLQPSMYQESVLRAYDDEASPFESRFAAAHDPFAFADALFLEMQRHMAGPKADSSNVYLCPLGPKPQAIGCGLVLRACFPGVPGGISLPEISSYESGHAEGVSHVWEFSVPNMAWSASWWSPEAHGAKSEPLRGGERASA